MVSVSKFSEKIMEVHTRSMFQTVVYANHLLKRKRKKKIMSMK